MCLDTITSTNPPPEGVGYKVFSKHGGRLLGLFQGSHEPRKTKKWLDSMEYSYCRRIKIYPYADYPQGWHIFTSLKNIKQWHGFLNCASAVVRKVKYRKAQTKGLESGSVGGLDVIVAKEIYIIPGEVK